MYATWQVVPEGAIHQPVQFSSMPWLSVTLLRAGSPIQKTKRQKDKKTKRQKGKKTKKTKSLCPSLRSPEERMRMAVGIAKVGD